MQLLTRPQSGSMLHAATLAGPAIVTAYGPTFAGIFHAIASIGIGLVDSRLRPALRCEVRGTREAAT